jgi:hypothetical protein
MIWDDKWWEVKMTPVCTIVLAHAGLHRGVEIGRYGVGRYGVEVS